MMHRLQRNARASLGTVLVLVATSLIGGTAHAEVTLSITPSLVELSATPGGRGSVDLTVTDNGSEAFDVTGSVRQSQGGGGDLSAVDWVTMEPTHFHLATGEHETVRVTITVPSPLNSGGRYATVMFKTGARAVAGTGIGVAGQLGVPLLIDVHGDGRLIRTARIDRLVPVLLTDGGIGFATSLVNRGNLHVVAVGTIDVERPDGTFIGSLRLPETAPLLPRSTVLMQTQDSLRLKAGASYWASATVSYGGGGPATSDAKFAVQAGMAIGEVSVSENHGRGPTIRVALENQGSVGLLPMIQFEVHNSAGSLLGTAAPPEPPLLLPHRTGQIRLLFPHELNKGKYSLVIRARYGTEGIVSREVSFDIGNVLPTPKGGYHGPAVLSTGGTPWWVILLALLGGLSVLGAALVGLARMNKLTHRRNRRQGIDSGSSRHAAGR